MRCYHLASVAQQTETGTAGRQAAVGKASDVTGDAVRIARGGAGGPIVVDPVVVTNA